MSHDLREESLSRARALAGSLHAMGAVECYLPVLIQDELYEVTVKLRPVDPNSDSPDEAEFRPIPVPLGDQIEAVSEALNSFIQSHGDLNNVAPSVGRHIDGLLAALSTLSQFDSKDDWDDNPQDHDQEE